MISGNQPVQNVAIMIAGFKRVSTDSEPDCSVMQFAWNLMLSQGQLNQWIDRSDILVMRRVNKHSRNKLRQTFWRKLTVTGDVLEDVPPYWLIVDQEDAKCVEQFKLKIHQDANEECLSISRVCYFLKNATNIKVVTIIGQSIPYAIFAALVDHSSKSLESFGSELVINDPFWCDLLDYLMLLEEEVFSNSITPCGVLINRYFPKLRHISISATTTTNDPGLNKIPSVTSLKFTTRNTVLTMRYIMEVLSISPNLRELQIGFNFSSTQLDLREGHHQVFENMYYLNLNNWSAQSEPLVLDCVLSLFPNLNHLNYISKQFSVQDANIIHRRLPKLEFLILNHFDHLHNSSPIVGLKFVELDMFSPYPSSQLTNSILWPSMPQAWRSTIETITLNRINTVLPTPDTETGIVGFANVTRLLCKSELAKYKNLRWVKLHHGTKNGCVTIGFMNQGRLDRIEELWKEGW